MLSLTRIRFSIICVLFVLIAVPVGGKNTPEVWLRPDSLISFPRKDSIAWTDEYTMVTVVRSMQPDSVQCLWGFAENDTLAAAVLTHGVYSRPTGVLRASTPRDFTEWCIYTYHGGIRLDSCKRHTLCTGEQIVSRADSTAADSLPANIEAEELAYFQGNVPPQQMDRFQTYLALKYGITLDHAPYISCAGDTLWTPEKDKTYYHRVAGTGHDTLHHWEGYTSHSKEENTLTLQADTLAANEYILAGDDGEDLVWRQETDGKYVTARKWQLRQHTKIPKTVRLALRLPDGSNHSDSLQLEIMDGNDAVIEKASADSIKGDSIGYFTLHSTIPIVRLQFCRVIQNETETKARSRKRQNTDTGSPAEGSVFYDAYNRTITVEGFRDDQVFELRLYDSSGKLCTALHSQSPIEIQSLPQTVYHIEILADGKIAGSISVPIAP